MVVKTVVVRFVVRVFRRLLLLLLLLLLLFIVSASELVARSAREGKEHGDDVAGGFIVKFVNLKRFSVDERMKKT